MTPKLVIFDCDGVLVDSEPVTAEIIAHSLAHYGLPIPVKEVDSLFTGGTMQDVRDTALAEGAKLPATWLDDIYSEMFTALGKGVPVFDGVFDLLDTLKAAGVHTAVASNGPTRKMEVTLKPSGLWDRLMPHIYSREDHKPKPAPDMLIHAMKVAGADTTNTVFIDDSIAGCRAGQAAMVKTYGFRPTGDTTDLESVGAIPMRSMDAIKLDLFNDV